MRQRTMIDAHSLGKVGLIVELFEEIGLVELFNKKLSTNIKDMEILKEVI